MEKPLDQSRTKAPTTWYNPCIDIDGNAHAHSEFYTPVGSPCAQCKCTNGRPEVCIKVDCEKPKCEKFNRVPGKCCDYKCINNDIDFTDKTTIAIVISLSIVLVFILIAIILVVRCILRKKRYGERLSSVTLTSQHQPLEETDLDDIIQKNSIPNNLRHPPPSSVMQTSTSSSRTSSSHVTQQNVNKAVSMETTTLLKNDLRKFGSELSCNSLDDEDDSDPSSQSDDGNHRDGSHSNQNGKHSNKVKVKRFEPTTLQYTPLSATSI